MQMTTSRPGEPVPAPVPGTSGGVAGAGPGPALQVAVLATPFAPLAVVVSPDDELVRGAAFGAAADLLVRLDPALRRRGVAEVGPSALAGPAAVAVERYVAGDLDALADVAVVQPGGPFLQAAWQVMAAIPVGQTWTYAQLAAKAGRPAAVRAAGQACARNLVAPFVPCHRVVRTGGTLGGYGYGLAIKAALLRHEGVLV